LNGGQQRKRKTAIVLSGGGARGAYEVGVLSYIFDDLTRLRRAPPRIDILSGSSVGAINACYLAAHLGDAPDGMRRLVKLWRDIELPRILGFGVRHALSLPWVLTGGAAEGVGVFDVRPIAELVTQEVPWRAVARALRRRHLQALSVSATEVSTGRTVIFMQVGPDGALPSVAPPRTVIRPELIGPPHALASAAIPILFPPVRIGKELYTDGGLRQNTPIAPALRLGATHVFAVGLSHEARGIAERPALGGRAPGAMFLLGKVLNAFLLDHIDNDLELLRRINRLLADAEEAHGPAFLPAINAVARRRGEASYRKVHALAIRPTEDLGRLAAEHVRRGKFKGRVSMPRRLLSLFDVGFGSESDLASYMLFDGAFASSLIDLGRADAAARRDQLLAFFDDDDDADPAPDSFDPEITTSHAGVAGTGTLPIV
jgi:NTE family protein